MDVYDGRILDAGGAVHNVTSTEYGAVANDPSVSDTQNIDALVKAVGRGRRVVVIPPGRYYYFGDIKLRASNVEIIGYGAVFVPKAPGTNRLLLGTSRKPVSNVVLRGVKFDYTPAAADGGTTGTPPPLSTSRGISASVRSGLLLEDVEVVKTAKHAFVLSATGDRWANVVLRRCAARGPGGTGFDILHTVMGYHLENCIATGTGGQAFFAQGPQGCLVSCYAGHTPQNGFRIHGAGTRLFGCLAEDVARDSIRLFAADCEVHGCQARSSMQGVKGTGNGVRIRDAANCKIIGGTFERCTVGVNIANVTGVDPVNALVSGATIRNNHLAGIIVRDGQGHRFVDCACYNNGSEESPFPAGIAGTVSATDVVCVGNRCYDDRETKLQQYGIRTVGKCDRWLVASNIVSGGGQAISLAGTGNVVSGNLT